MPLPRLLWEEEERYQCVASSCVAYAAVVVPREGAHIGGASFPRCDGHGWGRRTGRRCTATESDHGVDANGISDSGGG